MAQHASLGVPQASSGMVLLVSVQRVMHCIRAVGYVRIQRYLMLGEQRVSAWILGRYLR
jgi:hypothetical protein